MDAYPDTFAFVQIHHGDAYATTWAYSRADFYDLEVYPSSFFDGVIYHRGGQTYTTYEDDYLARRGKPTDVSIQVSGSHTEGETYAMRTRVCLDDDGTGKTMRIYMVQVLDYWPPAISYSRNGLKQAAATQDITLAPGDCQVVSRSFTFDADSWADQDNIKVIAWAQEPQNIGHADNRATVFQADIWTIGTFQVCEVDQLMASDPVSGDEFGSAISAAGSIAASGAPGDDCGAGDDCGSVYVHRGTDVTWTQEAHLTASDASATDAFGSAVSVGADTVVAGAPHSDEAGQPDAGSAYVYRDGGGTWGEEQKLVAPVPQQNAFFGVSVAVAYDMAVVGAENDGNTGGGSDGPGAAYVFRYGTGSWSLESALLATDATAADAFGTSVSAAGDVIVVGAPNADCGEGADCGAAYVYRWNGGNWDEEQKLEASDGVAFDWFGSSVTVEGDLIAVGSPLAECAAGANCGAVYIYHWNGVVWVEEGKVTAPDGKASDYLGWAVDLHDEVILAGAQARDCGEEANCGGAYFIRNDENVWTVAARVGSPGARQNDRYGIGVALAGDFGFVGGSLHDAQVLADIGAVSAFPTPEDCDGSFTADACDLIDGLLDDNNDDGLADICTCDAASDPQTDALGAHAMGGSNRYLSFSAGDPGAPQAVRVSFTDLPAPFDYGESRRMWVGEPSEFCENAGQSDPPVGGCGQAPGLTNLSFPAATLQCEPYYTDWSIYDLVHVWHEAIVPGGTYTIQVIDQGCDEDAAETETTPLIVHTSRWGDCVENCTITPCGPPDGIVNVTTDVTAVLDKFKNLEGAPRKIRCDVEPGELDMLVNITDVTQVLDAFRGLAYPFSGPSPTDPCAGGRLR